MMAGMHNKLGRARPLQRQGDEYAMSEVVVRDLKKSPWVFQN
jgi:hypothetical protein